MDIESHESALLLKESSPGPGRKRQGLALKLAVVLAGLALIVNLTHPMDTDSWPLSSIKEEKKVTAATEISPTPKNSVLNLDWRTPAVAAPAWSVEDHDTTRTPFGYCARGGGFRMTVRRDRRGLLRARRADLQRELPGPRRRVARVCDVTHGSRAAGF